MLIYRVGGAVRDALLGRPVHDHDWVVVGATPQQMLDQGFLPVGRDFPVFLHPDTREEYALARTERKSGPGYRGFVVHADPGVTLEQDLARRDLTINAMAQGLEAQAPVIDPYGGQADLAQGVLRHVTEAFREDPVRILRVARFAARFTDFSVAPETLALMRQMVDDGEVQALVPERVWQELARGLMEAQPERMLHLLDDCGAWAALFPNWPIGPTQLQALLYCTLWSAPLAVRYAVLTAPTGTSTSTPMPGRLRVPSDCLDLAALLARETSHLSRSGTLDATELVSVLERCDAWRKPERFQQLCLAHACLTGQASQTTRLELAHAAALTIDLQQASAQALAAGARGPAIGQAIRQARIAAVTRAMAFY